MRARDLNRFTAAPYDLLVIGGGIYGLAIAYEAASRGLRTALVEAGDFGGGNVVQPSEDGARRPAVAAVGAARSRARVDPRAARARAHRTVAPAPAAVPGRHVSLLDAQPRSRCAQPSSSTHGSARRRNDGVEPELHLPAPRLISKAATLRLFPGIRPDGLTGGAQWYDYQMVEADRLTFAFAEAADRSGADLANYVEAVGRRPRRRTDRRDGGARRAHRRARSRSRHARRSTRPARGRRRSWRCSAIRARSRC